MPQQRVDLTRGDEPLDLVARRIERLGRVPLVGQQRRELPRPVRPWRTARRLDPEAAPTTFARYFDSPMPSIRYTCQSVGVASTVHTANTACRRNESDAAWIAPGGLASISAWRNTAARVPGVASIVERVDADLGSAEVEVVNGPVRWARARDRVQRAGPFGSMRITARFGSRVSLAKWRAITELLPPPCPPIECVPVLAVGCRERHRAALVAEQHALAVALDLGGRDRAPDGRAQQRARA